MQYVLGNMLNGGGGLNADGLALDLQFALDKTTTARKGPTPTFTRASSGTFVGSNGLVQTAGTNVARFDHTSAGVCRGLLIEESRTNICLQSENFGTTWTNDSGLVTITTDVEVSPDGSITADKIAESASTTSRRISIQSISVTSGTTYSYSCYIKAGERDFAQMATGTGLNSAFQNFIVNGANAGTLGSSSGIVSSRIDAMPNGWYRCTIVVTATATGTTQVTVGPSPSSTITRWQAYSSTAGSGIYAWGAQLEAGSFPTSYIPTTTASVVRSADVCSIIGTPFTDFYNQSEGAIYAQYDRSNNNASGKFTWMVAAIYNPASSSTYNVVLSGTANDGRVVYRNAGVDVFSSIPSLLSPNTVIRSAYAYKSGDFAHARNGAMISTGTGTIPVVSSFDRIQFGFSNNGSFGTAASQYLNGRIAAIRIYRKRLANSKLMSISDSASSPSIFIVGSSTAAGTGATAGNSWASRFISYYSNVGNVFNLALGGQVISNSAPTGYTIPTGWTANPNPARNVTYAEENGGDIVLINYPSNFVNQTNGTTANYMAVLAAMVAYCNSNGMDYRVFTTQPRNDFDLTKRTILKDTADAIIATYGTKVVNTYAELADSSTLNLKATYNSGDGIHPNDAGHLYLYNQLIATL
jgi:hypothetical protein